MWACGWIGGKKSGRLPAIEHLDPQSDLDAEKCTHNSIRSQLHADILFLSMRPLITHAEMPSQPGSEINHIDLIF
jgi:hypothetical protein